MGCASREKEKLQQYRTAFVAGDFARASLLLAESGLKKDKKAELLWQMEKGSLAYAQANYQEAASWFQTALETIDRQYTISVRERAAKYLVNDLSESWYGSTFERSWAHYYLGLAHLAIWRIGEKVETTPEGSRKVSMTAMERREYLFRARAAMLAWDSFFQQLDRSIGKKALYRHDLVAKIVAAQVHETVGERADLQIASQLYKDAFNVFKSLANTLAAFNSEAKKFENALKEQMVEDQFDQSKLPVIATPLAAITKDFLQMKIAQLTLQLRPGEMPQVQRQFELDKEDIKAAEGNKRTNLVVMVEAGMIPAKISQTINIGLKGALSHIKDPKTRQAVEKVGVEVLTFFAMSKLGLMPTRENYTPGRFVMAHDMTAIAVKEAAIEFDVPAIAESASVPNLRARIIDLQGKIIQERPLVLVGAVGDTARQALDEEASERIIRTGVRVAMKHILAIASAITVYHSLTKGKEDNFLAKAAAMATYVGAAKAIGYSEKADTRHWGTLPAFLNLTEFSLPVGEYQLELISGDKNAQESKKSMGKITVDAQHRAVFAYRLPQI